MVLLQDLSSHGEDGKARHDHLLQSHSFNNDSNNDCNCRRKVEANPIHLQNLLLPPFANAQSDTIYCKIFSQDHHHAECRWATKKPIPSHMSLNVLPIEVLELIGRKLNPIELWKIRDVSRAFLGIHHRQLRSIFLPGGQLRHPMDFGLLLHDILASFGWDDAAIPTMARFCAYVTRFFEFHLSYDAVILILRYMEAPGHLSVIMAGLLEIVNRTNLDKYIQSLYLENAPRFYPYIVQALSFWQLSDNEVVKLFSTLRQSIFPSEVGYILVDMDTSPGLLKELYFHLDLSAEEMADILVAFIHDAGVVVDTVNLIDEEKPGHLNLNAMLLEMPFSNMDTWLPQFHRFSTPLDFAIVIDHVCSNRSEICAVVTSMMLFRGHDFAMQTLALLDVEDREKSLLLVLIALRHDLAVDLHSMFDSLRLDAWDLANVLRSFGQPKLPFRVTLSELVHLQRHWTVYDHFLLFQYLVGYGLEFLFPEVFGDLNPENVGKLTALCFSSYADYTMIWTAFWTYNVDSRGLIPKCLHSFMLHLDVKSLPRLLITTANFWRASHSVAFWMSRHHEEDLDASFFYSILDSISATPSDLVGICQFVWATHVWTTPRRCTPPRVLNVFLDYVLPSNRNEMLKHIETPCYILPLNDCWAATAKIEPIANKNL